MGPLGEEILSFRDRPAVRFEPLGNLLSAEFPDRHLKDHRNRFCFLRLQPVAVLEQKRPGCKQARPLVSIGKELVLEKAPAVGGRQFEGGWVLVVGSVLQARKGAF